MQANAALTSKIVLCNGLLLLVVGFWGFAANQFAVHTGLTPLIAGSIFVIFSMLLHKENIFLLRLYIVLSLILGLAFLWPFLRNFEQNDFWGMFRTGLEILSCLVSGFLIIKRWSPEKSNQA